MGVLAELHTANKSESNQSAAAAAAAASSIGASSKVSGEPGPARGARVVHLPAVLPSVFAHPTDKIICMNLIASLSL